MAQPFPKVCGFGWPSIRTKALSSNTYPARCFSHRVVARELEDEELWKSHGESLLGETVPPTIPRRGTMILLAESRPAPARPLPIIPPGPHQVADAPPLAVTLPKSNLKPPTSKFPPPTFSH